MAPSRSCASSRGSSAGSPPVLWVCSLSLMMTPPRSSVRHCGQRMGMGLLADAPLPETVAVKPAPAGDQYFGYPCELSTTTQAYWVVVPEVPGWDGDK
eukprot:7460378-Pyramimonas_sp.AAC.1